MDVGPEPMRPTGRLELLVRNRVPRIGGDPRPDQHQDHEEPEERGTDHRRPISAEATPGALRGAERRREALLSAWVELVTGSRRFIHTSPSDPATPATYPPRS